jgi:hypothetical protein
LAKALGQFGQMSFGHMVFDQKAWSHNYQAQRLTKISKETGFYFGLSFASFQFCR